MRINLGRSRSKIPSLDIPALHWMDRAEAGWDPVPSIDRDAQQGELHQFHTAVLQTALEDALAKIEPRLQRAGAAANGFSLGVMIISFVRVVPESMTRWIGNV